jgi:transcriptional regulator with PAS, ATPase and Fis domain
MFKFDLFKVAPIALQRIVDRISDSYIILNEDYEITDYNETFVKTFHITNASKLRGTHFAAFLKEKNLTSSIKEFNKYISKIGDNDKAKSFELYVQKINKFFNIEITSIIVNHQFLGILILFKDITQHIEDMQNLKNNQDLLIEQERLASLGQMIGRNSSQLKNTYLLSKWWIRRII